MKPEFVLGVINIFVLRTMDQYIDLASRFEFIKHATLYFGPFNCFTFIPIAMLKSKSYQ